jgi:hypothetical protein
MLRNKNNCVINKTVKVVKTKETNDDTKNNNNTIINKIKTIKVVKKEEDNNSIMIKNIWILSGNILIKIQKRINSVKKLRSLQSVKIFSE